MHRCGNRSTLLIAPAVLPPAVSFLYSSPPDLSVDLVHLKWCITFDPQLAPNKVQTAPGSSIFCNTGSRSSGFQQSTPITGVLLLDSPVSGWVHSIQLARRISPLGSPGCDHSVPGHQPPLAIDAPLPHGRPLPTGCAGQRAQAVNRQAATADDRQRAAQVRCWDSGTHVVSTLNCKPLVLGLRPAKPVPAVSASTQGVHSC